MNGIKLANPNGIKKLKGKHGVLQVVTATSLAGVGYCFT